VYYIIVQCSTRYEIRTRVKKDKLFHILVPFFSLFLSYSYKYTCKYSFNIVYSQRLHPTWEKVAEEIENTNVPVGIANVDCQAHSDLCREQRVMAFPTLRWYEAKEPQAPDYKSDRTVTALVSFARRKLELNEKFKDWDKKDTGKKQKYREMYSIPENPGCQVSGTLMGKI
jgi:hypothetical protein